MPVVESLLTRLGEARVEFVVVGGFAAMAHGATFLTQDIHICLNFSRSNLFRLRDALGSLHPVHRMTPQRLPLEINERNVDEFKNIYLETDYGPLDCLGEVKGIGDYQAVLALSTEVTLGGSKCFVLGIDGLIRAKEAMGRPHDQLTILQLRAIKSRSGEPG
jgi:hypothetical protein